MRLIDADKLLKFFTVDTANQTYRFGTVKKQIESAPTIKAIPLDKVKKAREEMDKLASHKVRPISFDQAVAIDMCIGILDKMITESEE